MFSGCPHGYKSCLYAELLLEKASAKTSTCQSCNPSTSEQAMRGTLSIIAMVLAVMFVVTTGHAAPAKGGHPMIKFETSMGDFVVELDDVKAPKTAANFLKYVEEGHYDGTIFHRVIDGFMVQGGGYDEHMVEKKTGAPIENEANNGLTNKKYTLAMARTNDPHSATAQFFINVNDNNFLNHRAPTGQGWGYAVFGRVVEGMDVIDKIKGVPTGTYGFHENVPRTPVVIKKVTVIK